MRIGISVGEPVDGFFGLFGEAVHLASLLCAGAAPGTTLVSSHFYQLEGSREYQFKPLPDLVTATGGRVRKYRLEGRRPKVSLRREAVEPAQLAKRVPQLSPRQVEVLCLVAKGKTNQEIAELLFVSESTIATHLRNIFERTGAANRAEAASFGYVHHLL
jgi:DNA-binding CsgD family transcriptional regulator